MYTRTTSPHRTPGMNASRRRPYRLPYYEQAQTWYRYARQLREKPFDAVLKKEEALAQSIRLRGRSFVLPARLEPADNTEQGLQRLRKRMLEEGQGFIELAARIVEVDEDDALADEVHLFLEETDLTSSRNRRHLVGRLPHEDAFWVVPLLRLEDDPYGTGPVLRIFVECCSTSEVRVVIAHAHEAARHWLDWKEEGAHRSGRSYRSTYYDERTYREA